MKILHVIDVISEEIIDIYFVDEETGEKLKYSIEEFLKDIRQ